MRDTLRSSLACAALLAACPHEPLPAQDLRHAAADADVLVIARQVGKRAFSDEVDLHRLQVLDVLRGGEQRAVTVIDWPQLSLHQRPQPRQSRLYCLHDAGREAARIGLPADQGPYYRMSGRAGSNPLIGADLDQDPIARLCRVFTASERGAPPAATTGALLEIALGGEPVTRLEATRHLAERPLLRTHLGAVQWSGLLSRMTGETTDLDYKMALAELCAEQRVPGLVDALLVGLDSVHEPAYARAVGRLCAHQLGDAAVRPLLDRLQRARSAEARSAALLALGATRTGPALDALLQLQDQAKGDPAVAAALREHGSRVAREAALRGDGR
ncbi:MAG: hypothetical protein AB7O97_02060 [Planctomycetota bacterium]